MLKNKASPKATTSTPIAVNNRKRIIGSRSGVTYEAPKYTTAAPAKAVIPALTPDSPLSEMNLLCLSIRSRIAEMSLRWSLYCSIFKAL